jgi:hypothetical protein
MRLAGAIVLLAAAVYTGCAMIAVSMYTADSNPEHAHFADAFTANLGLPVLIPSVLLWVYGIMLSAAKNKDQP